MKVGTTLVSCVAGRTQTVKCGGARSDPIGIGLQPVPTIKRLQPAVARDELETSNGVVHRRVDLAELEGTEVHRCAAELPQRGVWITSSQHAATGGGGWQSRACMAQSRACMAQSRACMAAGLRDVACATSPSDIDPFMTHSKWTQCSHMKT